MFWTGISAFLIWMLLSLPVYASGDYPVASCKSWNGTITEKSGINSRNALIKGSVTKADVQEYCERDPGGMTKQYGGKLTVEQCVAKTQQEIGKVDLVTKANCSTGTLVFQYGSRPPTSVRFPLGADANQSCASGMPPLIEQFKILCSNYSKAETPPISPEQTKSKDFCTDLLKIHGLATRAQFDCGFTKYSNKMMSDASECMSILGENEAKRSITWGMTQFDHFKTRDGQYATCNRVLQDMPTIVAK